MIQCVGSRNEERPYCSRICCSIAVKNALKIKEINPDASVNILYRDVRTYGMLEQYYTKARQQGVLFTRYDPDNKPEVVEEGGTISVTTLDPTIQRKVKLKADLLVLSAAVIPRDNDHVANLLKVSRTLDNFYLEAHMKLRPVDFANDGVFMAGLGHGPKPINESISQAAAAVSRACTIISKDKMQVGGVVAKVDPDKCAVCLICVRACPYNVPYIHEDGYSVIDPSLCQGCGNCVAECPQQGDRAAALHGSPDPREEPGAHTAGCGPRDRTEDGRQFRQRRAEGWLNHLSRKSWPTAAITEHTRLRTWQVR